MVEAYTCIRCGQRAVTRMDHAPDCPIRNAHPAEMMPQPKGYKCPACGDKTFSHREHGCDVDGCECADPFGRIMPGDPEPSAQAR